MLLVSWTNTTLQVSSGWLGRHLQLPLLYANKIQSFSVVLSRVYAERTIATRPLLPLNSGSGSDWPLTTGLFPLDWGHPFAPGTTTLQVATVLTVLIISRQSFITQELNLTQGSHLVAVQTFGAVSSAPTICRWLARWWMRRMEGREGCEARIVIRNATLPNTPKQDVMSARKIEAYSLCGCWRPSTWKRKSAHNKTN